MCVVYQVEQTVMPYLSAFASFRESVRRVARQQKGIILLIKVMVNKNVIGVFTVVAIVPE